MNEPSGRPVPTWSTWGELVSVITYPRHVKRTVTVALVVGTVFFTMNQLGFVLAGHATPFIWLKAVVTYVTPLCVSNFGIVSATRRRQVIVAERSRG
jgi:hypothetical protein